MNGKFNSEYQWIFIHIILAIKCNPFKLKVRFLLGKRIYLKCEEKRKLKYMNIHNLSNIRFMFIQYFLVRKNFWIFIMIFLLSQTLITISIHI